MVITFRTLAINRVWLPNLLGIILVVEQEGKAIPLCPFVLENLVSRIRFFDIIILIE